MKQPYGIFLDMLEGRAELDVEKSSAAGIEDIVQHARDLAADLEANRPWKAGTPAERQCKAWIAKCHEIVKRYGTDKLGERRLPGVPFPVETKQFGFVTKQASGGDQSGNVRLR